MSLARALIRASQASPHEWVVRGRQLLFSRSNEVLSILRRPRFATNGHHRSLGAAGESLSDWLSERKGPWLVSTTRRGEIRGIYRRHPNRLGELLQRADEVASGKMYVLGHGFVTFSGEDRWHRDPVLSVAGPHRIYSRIRYLDVEEVGDSKHVWEPNRFGWAYWLGAAHVATDDDLYAEKFAELTLDWFDSNPYPIGINYCSALELAFRAYAWIWALDLFRDYLEGDSGLVDKLLGGIWLSCLHVERNLSYYFSPNTHLLGEAFALYACGACIPEFAEAKRWREKGEAILTEEARKQVHRDGTHRELSSCYHLYATDFYVQASLIAQRAGLDLDRRIPTTALRLAERLRELVPGDGYLPQFNDCDGGRLTWFTDHPLDAAPSLEAADSLADEKPLALGDRDAFGYNLWLAESGPRPSPAPEVELPAEDGKRETKDLYDSGIVAYRNAAGDYLLFRSGPFGYLECGHSHDAPTGFQLYLAGRPVVVDSGVGHYSQNLETRNAFRTGHGKNILLVDGSSPSVPHTWFSWERTTDARLLSARRIPNGFFCHGSHLGFSTLSGRAEISRAITLLDAGLVVVVDRWRAEREIRPESLLTLGPGLAIEAESNTMRRNHQESLHYLAWQENLAPAASSHFLTSSAGPGPYSPGYGVVETTSTLRLDCEPSSAGCLTTIFSRAGEVSPAEDPRCFAVDRGRFSLRLEVNSDRELPATLTPAGASSR